MAGAIPLERALLGGLGALFLAAPAAAQGTADDDGLTESVPARVLEVGLLRAVYLDLLGRPPFLAERETWRGRQLADLLNELVDTREFWERWTDEQLYYFLLIDNFRPRSERVVAIPEDLRSERIGVKEAIHRIVLSSSFDQRNPGPDTFVTVVMEQLLGITVQKSPRDLEIGKKLYDGGSGNFLGHKGNSQADVVKISIDDKRFLRELIEREYQRLLRREPNGRDAARWASELKRDPYAFGDFVKNWILSPAYEERLAEKIVQPNRLYVRTMYVDLVDRLPDKEEERRMRGALDGLSDPGPLRSVLARLLLDSGTARIPPKGEIEDPTAWVAGLFERLLGRAVRPEELKSFVTAFHDDACSPSTVVYAIVSHPEYHAF